MATMRWVAGLFGLVLLSGCGHGTGATASSTASPAEPAVLVPPTNADDVTAWREFMVKSILSVTHDPKLHPYSFVVPAGDSADVTDRRKSEAMAIRMMLGNTAVPGNMIALTGPDSTKVADVIIEAFKGLPPHAAQGLAVLYVGVPDAADAAKKIVSAAGAELRVRQMRAPN